MWRLSHGRQLHALRPFTGVPGFSLAGQLVRRTRRTPRYGEHYPDRLPARAPYRAGVTPN